MKKWMEAHGMWRQPKISPETAALVRKLDKTLDRARVEFDNIKLELLISKPVRVRRQISDKRA